MCAVRPGFGWEKQAGLFPLFLIVSGGAAQPAIRTKTTSNIGNLNCLHIVGELLARMWGGMKLGQFQ